MLPCNVIVYGKDGGGTVVAAVDPDAMLSVVDNIAVARGEDAPAHGHRLGRYDRLKFTA